MSGAAAHVQHLLLSEPISFQETEPRILLWPDPPLPPIPIETMVTIVTAVVAILVTMFVPLLWLLGGARLQTSTPAGGSTEVRTRTSNKLPLLIETRANIEAKPADPVQTDLPPVAPPTSGVRNSVGGATAAVVSADLVEVLRRRR